MFQVAEGDYVMHVVGYPPPPVDACPRSSVRVPAAVRGIRIADPGPSSHRAGN